MVRFLPARWVTCPLLAPQKSYVPQTAVGTKTLAFAVAHQSLLKFQTDNVAALENPIASSQCSISCVKCQSYLDALGVPIEFVKCHQHFKINEEQFCQYSQATLAGGNERWKSVRLLASRVEEEGQRSGWLLDLGYLVTFSVFSQIPRLVGGTAVLV